MKSTLLALLLCLAIAATANRPQLTQQNNFNRGLRFTENKGQVTDINGCLRPDILFTSAQRGVNLYLGNNGIAYQFIKLPVQNVKKSTLHPAVKDDKTKALRYQVGMQLQGANPQPQILKEDEGCDYENFYGPQCPDGISFVKNYTRITYKDIYPHIDWVVYVNNNALEYDFKVNPGGDVRDIKIKYDGATSLQLNSKGQLVVATPLGSIIEHAPVARQSNGQTVAVNFTITDNEIGFCPKLWNTDLALVIDPYIEWATYYGGESFESGGWVKTDATGDVYLSGGTRSLIGIGYNGFLDSFPAFANSAAILVKFSSTGSRLWATYYGGDDFTEAPDMSIDPQGNIFLGGETASTTGIASGGFQNTLGGIDDGYLIKFRANGTRAWATYYGGTEFDLISGVAADHLGNVYVVGSTSSPGLATAGSFYQGGGLNDAFLAKFSSSGSRLWATYYGGSNWTGGNRVAVDSKNNVYMVGGTQCSGLAYNGFKSTCDTVHASPYLVKFSPTGTRLWATYYGGDSSDVGTAVATDMHDNIYMAGTTASDSGIAYQGFQNIRNGEGDGFLVKFDSSGNRLWATYYGGDSSEEVNSITTDAYNNVYLAGTTNSPTDIASGGFRNAISDSNAYLATDAFLVEFNSVGNRLWGTYYGGAEQDFGQGVAIDNAGYVYFSGGTESYDSIAYNGFCDTLPFNGNGHLFLAKIHSLTTTGTAEIYEPDITLYPNPVNDYFEISGLDLSRHYSISVFNSIGQQMYSGALNQNTVKPKLKAAGIYYVIIFNDTEVYKKKIVVVN